MREQALRSHVGGATAKEELDLLPIVTYTIGTGGGDAMEESSLRWRSGEEGPAWVLD